MSTKLITTVMVLAMLLAGTALAGEMHYKVYGKAHVSTEMLNNGDESDIFIASNSSRLGIKGKYATDVEWLNVVFQYESAADFNGEKGNTLSSRNSYAGVGGENWGKVIWGRHDTPFKTLGRKVDLFGDRIGDARNATSMGVWDQRVANMIMYASPKFGDMFCFQLQYVPEEGMESASFFSGSAYVSGEQFMVGVSFESHGEGLELGGESSTGIRAAGGYYGDNFKIVGLYQSISNLLGFEDASSTTFGLGAAMTFDAIEPKAQFYMMDPNTDVDDVGATMVVLGIDYHLNEKALLYLSYAMMMNDDYAAFAPFYGGHGQDYPYLNEMPDPADNFYTPAMPGETASGLALGLIAKW